VGALAPLKDLWLRLRERWRPPLERFLAYRRNRHLGRAYVRDLNFDLVSICNLRCIYCALDHERRAKFMEPELFERVLDEVADRRRLAVTRIQLHHGGDALIHPRFPELLELLARRRGPRFPEVRLLTNALLLRGKKAEAIFESGAVDYVRFSIDGGTREDFERMRPPAKWDRVLGNVEAFLEENERRGRPMRTGIITLFDREPGELDPRFTELSRRVDHYMPRPPHNWDGSTDLGLPAAERIPPGLCMFVLFQAVVLYDGRVVPCCADLNGRGPIGHLDESSLRDIVKGEARARMVRAMRRGRRRDLDLCRDCDVPLQ
jgi:uncharacterized Fe-S cluster-containing radical SAM superfamily protein